MKGMLNFLEKAGLVTRDAPDAGRAAREGLAPAAAPTPATDPLPEPASGPTPGGAADEALPSLNLEDIYAQAGVPAAAYPAERLLRLVDGLAAMDPAVRLMAIQAMDAADESWTLADPLNDAALKLQALTRHGEQLQASLSGIERQTQALLDQAAARHQQNLSDIQRQMAELQALAEREQARAAQEQAAHQARLQLARERTAQSLASLNETRQRLDSLTRQLGPTPTSSKE